MPIHWLMSLLGAGSPTQETPLDIQPTESIHGANDRIDAEAAAPTTGDDSPLLELPAEMRNRIYRYVLCEEGRIAVNRDMREPGFLATCKQVRAEAKAIWMLENRFDITITALDATTMRLFSQYLERAGGRGTFRAAHLRLDIRESYRWDRLMGWCGAVYRGECRRYHSRRPRAEPYKQVIGNALYMARQHREQGQSWEACQASLGILRNLAGLTDHRWLED